MFDGPNPMGDVAVTTLAAPISVVHVDDANVVSAGLRALLDRHAGFDLIGEVATVAQAEELDADPDVVVSDVELEDAHGAEVVSLLAASFRRSAILALTLIEDVAVVQRVLDAGATGYILKSATPYELYRGLRAVARGELYLQPALGVTVARGLGRPVDPSSATHESLSATETEIMRLLVLGHTNGEIARMRGVSLRTVESQRAHIFHKLGRHTRAELVRYARAHGLVDDAPS